MLVNSSREFMTKADASPIRPSDRAFFPVDRDWPLLRLIADNSPDLLTVEDGYDEYVYASPSSVQLFGWTQQELCSRPVYALLHADDVENVAQERALLHRREEVTVRYRMRCRSGEYRWVESRSRMGKGRLFVVTLTRDIHEEVQRLQELERLTYFDSLTNLPNRRALESVLYAELQRSRRHAQTLSLAFFDIDRFKHINDGQGHQAGDQVLQRAGACVQRYKRIYDTLGRWGGDEFLILFPKTTAAEAADIVRRVRAVAARELAGVTLSFGISSTDGAESAAVLLAHADAALYQAKHGGGNRAVAWNDVGAAAVER